MTIENELDAETAATGRHIAAAKMIAAELHGWKIDRQYVAKRGSVYVTFVSLCEKQYLTKLRIADHEETSDNHAAADLTLIVLPDGSADIAGCAAAIAALEDGGTY
jgi:hypothetical protein